MTRQRRLAALVALAACAGANAGRSEETATEATGRRRRRLGGSLSGARGSLDNGREASQKARNGGFYDLALMSEDEKLDLIKQAYALSRHGDSVDWEGHVLTAAVGGNDDAYDGEVDDTLSGDIVVDANGRVIDDGEGALEASDETPNEKQSSNDDDQDSDWDDTLDWETRAEQPHLQIQSQPLQTSHRRLAQYDGDVFNGYNYNKGRCPNAGSLGVPCAPPNLAELCNKYDRTNGSFRACLDACKPAFCCIHDAPREENYLAPNCNTDENCAQYNYCYIAWWKLHDTVGPALFLRVEQDDEFYDVDAEEIESDSTGDEFFTQVLLHHFDDIDEVIADGTVDNEFNADRIFLDEEYWVYPVAGQVDLGN